MPACAGMTVGVVAVQVGYASAYAGWPESWRYPGMFLAGIRWLEAMVFFRGTCRSGFSRELRCGSE